MVLKIDWAPVGSGVWTSWPESRNRGSSSRAKHSALGRSRRLYTIGVRIVQPQMEMAHWKCKRQRSQAQCRLQRNDLGWPGGEQWAGLCCCWKGELGVEAAVWQSGLLIFWGDPRDDTLCSQPPGPPFQHHDFLVLWLRCVTQLLPALVSSPLK